MITFLVVIYFHSFQDSMKNKKHFGNESSEVDGHLLIIRYLCGKDKKEENERNNSKESRQNFKKYIYKCLQVLKKSNQSVENQRMCREFPLKSFILMICCIKKLGWSLKLSRIPNRMEVTSLEDDKMWIWRAMIDKSNLMWKYWISVWNKLIWKELWCIKLKRW